jgi:hypothetical protein
MANTGQQTISIITTNLNPVPNPITAQRHRLVETAVLDYTAGQILAAGESSGAGDANGTDTVLTCNFQSPLPNLEYMVVGHLVSLRQGGGWNADNDVVWSIVTKTTTGFKVFMREWNEGDQQLKFNYIAISTPGQNLPTTW